MEQQTSPSDEAFIRLLRSPLRFKLYLLTRLPSAFFAGLRISSADESHCSVSIPFKWFTKNPFRSTYFACLSMAAEMSTGVLAMSTIYKKEPPISLLVVGMEASFHKKATGRTTFTCVDGAAIRKTIQKAATTGEACTIKAHTVGTNPAGEIIAEFYITWSFKRRDRK